MTLPVVWIPEANEDLLAWYDNIRPELGERFARAVEVAVEAIASIAIPCCLPEPSPCGSAAVPLRNILRGSAASDCGNRLLPRQAQSEALAVTVKRSAVARKHQGTQT